MARTVDIAQQERQKADIAAAVWRLAARSGLESVSLREVAAEAGISMGRVQHYFDSKDAMLRYGLHLASQRMDQRIEQRLAARKSVSGRDILYAALDELFGDDPDTRQAVRVSVAYLGRALDDPAISEVLFADDRILRTLTAEVVRAAHPARPAADAEREAHIVWSLANGLAIEIACGQTTSEQARALMDHHLTRVLGAPPPDDVG